MRFAVRLAPRTSSNRVDGVLDGVLNVRVTAPAVEGAANSALVHLLADELGVAGRDVRIVAGAVSRQKLVVWMAWIGRSSLPDGRACGYDRTVPHGARCASRSLFGRLAQWLEHAVHIRGVTGSNPVSPTIVTQAVTGPSGPVSVSRSCS